MSEFSSNPSRYLTSDYQEAMVEIGLEKLRLQLNRHDNVSPLYNKPHDLRNIKPHPRFYFPDGNVVFLVEDVLYNVHRYFFRRDSSVFDGMFSLPHPVDKRPEGDSLENPIILEGIGARDFDRLLSLLYPIDIMTCEIKTAEEWTSVLHLASRWEFVSLHRMATKHLAGLLDDVDKVHLGQRFDIPEWILPAFVGICMREKPLSLEEGKKLSMEDVIKIGIVRYEIRYPANLKRAQEGIEALVNMTFCH